MRKLLALFLGVAFSTAAYAQEPDNNNIGERIEAATPVLRLASLLTPGETLEWGDLVLVQRPFGSWSLKCEMRPSLNKRLCATEQLVNDGKQARVAWRIAMSDEYKPVIVFSLPALLDVQTGLRIGFSGLEKTISGSEWTCGASGCLASFPFEGFVQAAITNSSNINFSYRVKQDTGFEDVKVTSSMGGFSQALDAAAKDPFGKTVPVKQVKPAEAKAAPVAKSMATEKVDAAETASVTKTEKESAVPSKQKAQPLRRKHEAKPAQHRNITPRDGLY